MILTKISDGIYGCKGGLKRLGPNEISIIFEELKTNTKGRVRICTHNTTNDILQEMFIAISSKSYIRPHLHITKSESFYIVKGEVDVILFQEDGRIREVLRLGDFGTNKPFYCRFEPQTFHTLVIRSEYLILHEVTSGPFLQSQTVFADFSPAEDEPHSVVAEYMAKISLALENSIKESLSAN